MADSNKNNIVLFVISQINVLLMLILIKYQLIVLYHAHLSAIQNILLTKVSTTQGLYVKKMKMTQNRRAIRSKRSCWYKKRKNRSMVA